MKTANYLDQCKKKLNITSTYKLAQIMEVDERKLHDHYKGKGASEYINFKIAQILELDPAYVIADIKSETEKDEGKREFFKSFAGSLQKTVKIGMVGVILNAQEAISNSAGGIFSVLDMVRIMYAYVKGSKGLKT